MTQYGLFLLLLVFHVLGDFYVQTDAMARAKARALRATLLHALYYAIPFLLLGLLDPGALPLLLAAVVLHGAVDLLKLLFLRYRSALPFTVSDALVFLTDQALHVAILLALTAQVLEGLRFQRLATGGDVSVLLTWTLAILLLVKPANIAFKVFYRGYQPPPPLPREEATLKGAGAQIGALERILMLLFLSMGSIPALGLIMTAKSIARYDRITKDPAFAEYYLIGTLYSILITVILYVVLF